MSEHRQDTRSRIQDVALDLFTEQGYEATSLREIAERLGVTKAALYYHFKSKDEIVTSFMEDRAATLERLVAWGQAEPRTDETRRELVRRYAAELAEGRHYRVMRFLERNQTALRDHPKSERVREVMYSVLELLNEANDPLPLRIKSSLALFAMHATWFITCEQDYSDEEREDAALQVALELIDAVAASRQPTE